ncbi:MULTISPECIES: glycosyl hydrolase family 28-related protein [unclassified Kitasatospora]|uniref:glycosyl hydrolase family 28-related protein n=1 Tax=unclassified Kitasatospora TaxID=2633591 RepID=UPI0033DFAA69
MSENVLAHGADATGTTDSTTAFRKAIDALGKRGGIVEIPVGRYRIDQAPIEVTTPVHFRGDGGMVRTAVDEGGVNVPGSVTTLLFPPDQDGFVVVAPSSANAHFEGLALIRTRASGPAPERFARRGIHAENRIWAESLYLLNWERGIDLDGRTNHPAEPDHITAFATNDSYVSRIFAEDCFWATYAHGQDAQASHFEHIVTLSCEAGIYDSSLAGNGYVDCYVDGGFSEPPYYMDTNQSVLLNCRCESDLPPQLGPGVTVVGGGFNVGGLPAQVAKALGVTGAPFRQINGVPARHEGAPFPGGTANFAAGEQIVVTVDGVARTVAFAAGAFTPRQVAERINAAFADLALPRVATGYGFDNSLTVEGWRGHVTGTVTVTGDPATLAKIGFPAPSPTNGLNYGQLLSAPETAHVTFRAHSGLKSDGTPGINEPGFEEQLEVVMAYDGIRPMFWQARGDTGDAHEFGILRDVGKGVRRWAFTRASLPSLISLGFTMPQDSLGADQVVAYDGLWIQAPRGRRILLCSGVPNASQGTLEDTQPPTPPHDFAWDLAAGPPKRYVRMVTGWVADPAAVGSTSEGSTSDGSTSQPAPALDLTLDQRSLVTVDDAAGQWQFEGGEVLRAGSRVADYASSKRVVTGGTDTLHVAMLTLSLFFVDLAGAPTENLTLQGTHNLSSGEANGSVSAATPGFADRIGAGFRQVGQALTIH